MTSPFHLEVQGVQVPFRITRRKNARNVTLRFDRNGQLRVSAPRRMSDLVIQRTLYDAYDWIVKAKRALPRRICERPSQVCLDALSRDWAITYLEDRRSGVRLRESDNMLVLQGAISQTPLCLAVLRKWLINQAKALLIPLAEQRAREHGFPKPSLRIRNQNTRWGSGATNAHLSLNCKLMFLHRDLVNHVILHELCHIRHPHHGPAFWQLLSSLDPQMPRHKWLLSKAWTEIPEWAHR
ncbi:MAG: DUF45 domain-containing protein [Acidobacteria bacterium]|nr:DUF45 domain-containing protein [Acidobacteriota bacterium]